MRVFCPEHKKGFFAPRQSPIKCENRGHVLGELDFEGEAKPAFELQWQYCCNCEHFCPVQSNADVLEHCPVCTRRTSLVYICDRCYTISFESNTPLQSKNFTLTSEGAPLPSCPGCLQATSVDLREHTCDELGASFVTALSSCPICRERLDIGPSFPSALAHYLRRTKAANKLSVTFDYESELFVAVEDGEFVLVTGGDEDTQPIVLPRSTRFTTPRDFYEFYQDYYHCAKPDAGEVHVIEPAAVIRVAEGWKFQGTGVLEMGQGRLTQNPPATLTSSRSNTSTLAKAQTSSAAVATEEQVHCRHCGALVETRYAFCWGCGKSLSQKSESRMIRLEIPQEIVPQAAITADDEELTVQHEVRDPAKSMFSFVVAKEPERPTSASRSVLRLFAIAVVSLAIVAVGIFLLTRSQSRMPSVAAAQTVTENVQFPSVPASNQKKTSGDVIEPGPQKTSATRSEDEELKRLRERRIAAKPSDSSNILQNFVQLEKRYPDDYRFPYERAKLAIEGRESASHDEAFAALSRAAGKAISAGKTQEMLKSLEQDKAGDFHKLSHGHREWTQLQEALRSKDTKVLSGF